MQPSLLCHIQVTFEFNLRLPHTVFGSQALRALYVLLYCQIIPDMCVRGILTECILYWRAIPLSSVQLLALCSSSGVLNGDGHYSGLAKAQGLVPAAPQLTVPTPSRLSAPLLPPAAAVVVIAIAAAAGIVSSFRVWF